MHLVIWGHEHESIPQLQKPNGVDFFLYQPGSTIPTSLIQAEAERKHVGFFVIQKDSEGYQIGMKPYFIQC